MSKIVYERTACSRCGGSGSYSYNSIDGDRCFRCHGKGETLSRAGVAAKEAITAAKTTLCAVPVESIEVGDWVYLPSRPRPVKVEEVGPSGSKFLEGEEWIPFLGLRSGRVSHGFRPGTLINRFPTPEQWAELFALAETLPGATVEYSEVVAS